jgi:tetratricopeptide (TPR) repeat protein
MSHRTTMTFWLMLAALAVGGQVVWAQDDTTGPLVGSDVGEYVNALTPEEIDDLIAQANERRLEMERRMTIVELRQDPLFDPLDVDEAIAMLTAEPARDRQESVEHTLAALAMVHPQFARARQLLADGETDEALAMAERLVDPNEASYLSAAAHVFYARALAQAGRHEEATLVYRAVLTNMTERMSLAATAAWEGAEVFEEMGWFLDAGTWYSFLLRNYSLTLTSDEYELAQAAYEQHQAFIDDPLGTIVARMDAAREDLQAGQTASSADGQEEIVRMIEDILRETQPPPNQPPCPPCNQPPPEGGEGQQPQPQGGSGSQDQQERSTNPATSEHLPGDGVRGDPNRGATVHMGGDTGDWAALPPGERERYEDLVQRGMDDRYQEISREYHEELAEEGND